MSNLWENDSYRLSAMGYNIIDTCTVSTGLVVIEKYIGVIVRVRSGVQGQKQRITILRNQLVICFEIFFAMISSSQ